MNPFKLVQVDRAKNWITLQKVVTNKHGSRTMRVAAAATPELVNEALQLVGSDVLADLVQNDVPSPGMRLVRLQSAALAA